MEGSRPKSFSSPRIDGVIVAGFLSESHSPFPAGSNSPSADWDSRPWKGACC